MSVNNINAVVVISTIFGLEFFTNLLVALPDRHFYCANNFDFDKFTGLKKNPNWNEKQKIRIIVALECSDTLIFWRTFKWWTTIHQHIHTHQHTYSLALKCKSSLIIIIINYLFSQIINSLPTDLNINTINLLCSTHHNTNTFIHRLIHQRIHNNDSNKLSFMLFTFEELEINVRFVEIIEKTQFCVELIRAQNRR